MQSEKLPRIEANFPCKVKTPPLNQNLFGPRPTQHNTFQPATDFSFYDLGRWEREREEKKESSTFT
jgi:hypothetical protein